MSEYPPFPDPSGYNLATEHETIQTLIVIVFPKYHLSVLEIVKK